MTAERIVDVRGMEIPEPLLRALAALDDLARGQYLHLLSNRDPVLLYPLLEQQGFGYESHDLEGTVHVLVWRDGDITAQQAASRLSLNAV